MNKDVKIISFEKNDAYLVNFNIYFAVKRLLDLFFSIIGIILLSPVMLIIAIAIKCDSKGPVLFRQLRTGYKGKNFYVLKFRSMQVDNDVHDFSKKDQHTKVGAFLRKTSLDELPQLFCVFSGKMSFIGPRPWITDYYKNMNKKEKVRYDVLPGITGLAQTKGRNNISIFEKINYDIEYVRDYSLFEDIKIIFLTIKTVLSKDGADAGKGTIEKEINDLIEENTIFDMKPIIQK